MLADGCFKGSSIETFIVPTTLNSLSEGSFYTNNLKAIKVCHKDFKDLNYTESTFANVSNVTLYVPEGSKDLYENYYPWKNFKAIKEYDEMYDEVMYNAYHITCIVPSEIQHAKASRAVPLTSRSQAYADIYNASGIDIDNMPVPIKEGYVFKGWKGLPKVMPAKDITVEAIFENTTGVDNVESDESMSAIIYTVNGIKLGKYSPNKEYVPGVYILKYHNGKTEKVTIK